ncbi:MAG TPA: carboxypeptidase-like regulatory domain-containing protein [Pyrinomonadaceae bacterium]
MVTKIRIDTVPRQLPDTGISTTPTTGGRVAQLTIDRAFLGIEGKEVEIFGTATTCDYDFKEGERYLVYAYRMPDGKNFYTHLCSGTSPVSQATEAIAYLSHPNRTNEGAQLLGRISRTTYDAGKHSWRNMPSLATEIFLQSGDQRFRALTNTEGRFYLTGLSRGHYKIGGNPQVNFSGLQILAKEPQTEWDIDIPGQGCVETWFEARPQGEISGEVVDTTAQDLWVDITFGDHPNTETDGLESAKVKDGKFKFSFLPAGTYIIGFSMNRGPSRDYPYAEFYYPSVSLIWNAWGIPLREGQRSTGWRLQPPPRVAERTLEGVAVWPDGRPAVDVPIQLLLRRTGWRDGNPVTTDSQGRFAIVGMEGQTYRLSALVHKGIPLVNSKPLIVKLGEVNKPVRFVIVVP